MHYHHGQPGPPLTLAERLEQLNNNLQSMGDRLKEAIAGAIGTTVADAVRDAIHRLLGGELTPPDPPRYQDNRWQEEQDRSWHDRTWNDPADDPWQETESYESEPRHRSSNPDRTSNSRLKNALGAALQTSLWWLREQKNRRPILTTGIVAVAAGVTAFFYGPVLAAGVGTLASVASLFLTANGASSAAEQLAGIASG